MIFFWCFFPAALKISAEVLKHSIKQNSTHPEGDQLFLHPERSRWDLNINLSTSKILLKRSVIAVHGAVCQKRLMAHSSWGKGFRVMPMTGVRSRSSSDTPGAGLKWKRWRREVKKRKSSIFAKPSPRQILRPATRRSGISSNGTLQGDVEMWTYLQRRAWRHLFWQIYPLHPGSGRGWKCAASPIRSHHSGQKWGQGWQSSPMGRYNLWRKTRQHKARTLKRVRTFSMKYPLKVVSRLVLWGRLKGTMLASLWVSWMTASMYGRFFLSSTRTWRFPTTLLSSSWTRSEWIQTDTLQSC